MDEGEYVDQDEEDVRKKNICQSYNQIDEVPKGRYCDNGKLEEPLYHPPTVVHPMDFQAQFYRNMTPSACENIVPPTVNESLGGFGSGHHQGQGTPPGPKGTYRGTYRSPTNTALTSAEGIEHTTFCKEEIITTESLTTNTRMQIIYLKTREFEFQFKGK